MKRNAEIELFRKPLILCVHNTLSSSVQISLIKPYTNTSKFNAPGLPTGHAYKILLAKILCEYIQRTGAGYGINPLGTGGRGHIKIKTIVVSWYAISITHPRMIIFMIAIWKNLSDIPAAADIYQINTLGPKWNGVDGIRITHTVSVFIRPQSHGKALPSFHLFKFLEKLVL